jgi:uncharacterized protein (TIGR02996 family)
LLALLAAYKADPEDAVRGLVLADWLEENGDPILAARGELVRLQSQAPRTDRSKARQAELLKRYGTSWLGPLRAVAMSYVWGRGLLHLGLSAEALPERLAAEDFVWVEGVTVRALNDEQVVQLAAAPWLTALTTLVLSGGTGDEGAAALAASPHTCNLRTLVLRSNGIGDDGAAALARSPTLVNLSVLSLAYNDIHDEGVQALAASPHLAHMRQLNLEGNHIGHWGMPALRAAAQANPRLWIHVGGRTQL